MEIEAGYRVDLSTLRHYHQSGQTKSLASRLNALNQLEKMIRENTESLYKALKADLQKPEHEALVTEVALTLEEIHLAKKNLKKWMKPQVTGASISQWPSRNKIYFESLGVALIIGPWNYPFQLLIVPLVGALAAGNCAVLKPSELTPNTSHLISKLIGKYLSTDLVRVVLGGVEETTALLNLKFDYIFFTGSTAVGKIVMKAASQHLTPVTLELGGKSPAIVCEDADLDLAARRIVWGKFYNAGQTCIAPDYLYVHESVVGTFVENLKSYIHKQYGAKPLSSPDFARIINVKNTERIASLIDKSKVSFGGNFDAESRFVEPTIMENVSWNDKIMSEEIFGPVLPILTYKDLNSVFATIRSKAKPLSAYFFSQSSKHQRAFVAELSFGGGCINDVLVHVSNPYLPFGGVGDSGMGSYHGFESFKTFSHRKSVMTRYGLFDFSARYAPYSQDKIKLLRRIFGI